MAHYLDENGLLYLWLALKTLFAGKVDKANGKDLSTNDYTTAEKTKLGNIEAGAEVNDISSITVNGSAVQITNKNAEVSVPTKTSDLTNDSNFITSSDAANTYATKQEITNAYRYKGTVSSVSDLPSSGNTAGDVYNVEANDMNYAWTGTAWDPLGATFTITSITNAEIDAILAQ